MELPEQPARASDTKNGKRTLLIAGGLAIVLLVLIAAAFIQVNGFSMFDRIRASIELRGLRVAERNYTAVSVSSFGIMSLSQVTPKSISGTLSDYARARGVEVGIVNLTDTAAQEVVLLGSKQSILTGSGSAKASLAVSPDGNLIAYAVQTSGAQSFSSVLSTWTVRILNRETGSDTELGTGFGPQFFTRDGATWLLYTSADAITVTKVGEGSFVSFSTPFEINDDVWFAAKVSPDGRYLALRDAATRQFSLYGIRSATTDLPLGLDPLTTDLVGLYDVAFAGGSVYGIDAYDAGIDGGVAVLKINPSNNEEGKPVYLFPASGNYRLIP